MMQLIRPPGTAKSALGLALEALSQADMNAATGVSPQALWEASNPNAKKQPALQHCAALAGALQARGLPDPVTAFFEQHRDAVAARMGGAAPHQPLPPVLRMAQVTKEVGDVAGTMAAALVDGHLCPADRDAIEREAVQAIEKLQKLRRDLAALPPVAATVPVLPLKGRS